MSMDALSYLKRNAKTGNPIDYRLCLFYFKEHYPLTDLVISNLDLFIRIVKKNLPKFKTNYRKPLIEHYIFGVKDEDYWAPKIDSFEQNKFYYYLFLRVKIKECLRESENQLREKLGYKRIGEGNIKEHSLFNELCKYIDSNRIRRHYRPKWLNGLELDFFIETHKLGIEYQGEQHVKPIDYFGGMKSFKNQIKRDIKKVNLCHQNKIRIVHCYFDQSIPNFVNSLFLKFRE
ncbi:PDDEXK family nuclease [Leptospira levettii]|nr:hypothetical protein [Leptospira levettii]MCW7512095.1 hypothetical protein [Leptospira levettii]